MLQVKCDLAASRRALSLRFSSQSRELKQKVADSPRLTWPSQGRCCASRCGGAVPGVSFAPRQVRVSAGGTPGSGSAAGWARWMTHKSWVCALPAGSKASRDAAGPLQGDVSLPEAALHPLVGG